MAPHSSTPAWKIPWTEEPGRPQSMGSLRVGHERLHFHFSLSCIGEGNGNPLQCPCLENPRDGGAWWAAVYGVAQSRTRLKRRSSSTLLNAGSCKSLGSVKSFLHSTSPVWGQHPAAWFHCILRSSVIFGSSDSWRLQIPGFVLLPVGHPPGSEVYVWRLEIIDGFVTSLFTDKAGNTTFHISELSFGADFFLTFIMLYEGGALIRENSFPNNMKIL